MKNLNKLALVATTALTLVSFSAFASEGSTKKHEHKHHAHEHHQKSSWTSGLYGMVGAGFDMNRFKTSVNNSALSSSGTVKKNSFDITIGLGKRINKNIRSDITLSFAPNTTYSETAPSSNGTTLDINNSLQTSTLLANLYYDFDHISGISPYVMGGMGASKNKMFEKNVSNSTATKTSFAWQIGTGISKPINEKITLDIGYRYIDKGNFTDKLASDAKQSYSAKLKTHSILASVRVGF